MAQKILDLNALVLDAERKLTKSRQLYEQAAQERQALAKSLGGISVYMSIARQFTDKTASDVDSGAKRTI